MLLCVSYLNLYRSLGRFPAFLLLLYLKTQNYLNKIKSQDLECILIIVIVTKRVVNYRSPLYRYLASGCSYYDIHFSYRIGISTASKTVIAVCLIMWFVMRPERISRPTEEHWELTALEFERRTNFLHCLGTVSGKHIRVNKAEPSGPMFCNYKDFSMVLMAVADTNCLFVYVYIGRYG